MTGEGNWPDSRIAIAVGKISADCRSPEAAHLLGEMVAAFLAERAQHGAAVTAARQETKERWQGEVARLAPFARKGGLPYPEVPENPPEHAAVTAAYEAGAMAKAVQVDVEMSGFIEAMHMKARAARDNKRPLVSDSLVVCANSLAYCRETVRALPIPTQRTEGV